MMLARLLKRIRTKIRLLMRDRRRRSYAAAARRIAESCGAGLKVNHPCRFTRQCRFGDNCNFNGMTVLGKGTVSFGNNFHSGENCRIITQNHNFDHGTAIPYDGTYVLKNVVPPGAIMGGNPARLIRYRDMEHYSKLKAEGRFH